MLAQRSEPAHARTGRYGRQSEQEGHSTRGRARPVEGNDRGERPCEGDPGVLPGAHGGGGMSAHLYEHMRLCSRTLALLFGHLQNGLAKHRASHSQLVLLVE